MNLAILIIVFLFALIISNVINRMFPKIPLPFIQLVFGLAFGFMNNGNRISVDPELFLAFVIAPLNFREGQETHFKSLVKYRSMILYLILPGVFLTTIVIGLVAKSILPIELPLAACFALGASLGPTDAVAFIAMSKRFHFPKRVENILKLEGF
ncbi:hypothetical protein HMPREF9318_02030 [Streptococcus urinalis FB127-CNA-2]|uniref:Sodium, potassium, lithium and rubidium/H(+) antiporter domain protein n=1 Tax=Streptococcus urinalis 2285-97 TaxID=764291 RepID=G5KCK7_9STRE|nr:sodium, potassium, lithium and rubidium/H(+) antiporter domain protein [Streptococcus urinalis 2285-97]EKS17153.1 hypothetical protein HMPREF9318_02030 [Streptococcus urinalis FB127-CNA-2]VEF32597.1 Na+/H+ antiporter [Streptococcus urinalis]